jgi:cyclophilin family peptidyl-prolyl cis-trans isomerase
MSPTIHFSVVLFAVLFAGPSQATTVQFDTTFGNFNVELFDTVVPNTVANFLNYVSDGDYTETVVHRTIPGSLLHGGGFYSDGTSIPTDAPITNEFSLSNVRGTLTMARPGVGDPNSATSQWFINFDNNSSFLDDSNGGYTVFGEVVDMTIVDAVAALPWVDGRSINPAWNPIPVLDSSLANPDLLAPDNLFVINSIAVIPEPFTRLFPTLAFSVMLAIRRSRIATQQ